MDEKRMVGDYTVINSMYIGHREIILGENQKAASGERYVCCYAERVMFYEQYLEAQVSDDFAEIVKLYGERMTQAADEIMKETEKVTSEIGMNDEITAKDCKPISHDDAIEDKVIRDTRERASPGVQTRLSPTDALHRRLRRTEKRQRTNLLLHLPL